MLSLATQFNPELDLILRRAKLQLCTPRAIYSYDTKYVNFAETIKRIGPHRFQNSEILILGLGLGSIPLIFEKCHRVEANFTVLEIDPEIIKLCSHYVLPGLKSSVQIYEGDARYSIDMLSSRYHLICMDIFEDDLIPETFKSEEFLFKLRDMLHKDGLILYNLLYTTKEDKLQTEKFKRIFAPIFPDWTSLEVDGNVILINKNL